MPPPWFVRAAGKPEFWTGERCFITELLNDPTAPDTSLARARVETGVTTQLHRLEGTAERYIVCKGEGVIEVEGVKQELAVGDSAIISPGATQRITNTSKDDLIFYCLCTPRFEPECYVALEN